MNTNKITKTFFNTKPEGVWLSAHVLFDSMEGLLFIPKGVIENLDGAIRSVAGDPYGLSDMVDSKGGTIPYISASFNFELPLDQIFTHISEEEYGLVMECNISLIYSAHLWNPNITAKIFCKYFRFNDRVLDFSVLRYWEDIDIEDEFPNMEE